MVSISNVSKLYRLGLTRTSLPNLLSQRIKEVFTSKTDSRERDALWALKDVSLDLGRGESLALVGQNGAGKTTILKLLAGITRPTSGTVEVNGQLSALIELGAGFHPDLTGRENVFLNGTILGLHKNEISRRFDEIVDFSEIERFIDTPVKRYSSGMVVRLGFAIAACVDPDVLLVDEVLAVGDASFRAKCLRRIEALLKKGTSLVFVSHNFYLVQAICSSALYLHKGEVRKRGGVREVIAAYERDLHHSQAADRVVEISRSTDSSAELVISRVEVRGLNGSAVDGLRSRLPAQVVAHYVAHRPLKDLNVAVHIVRADGVTCCMARTSLDSRRFSLNQGPGAIVVTLDPIQLVGGQYYAEAHFLNESDSLVITSAASDWFQVSGAGLSYEEHSGVFEPNTSWERLGE